MNSIPVYSSDIPMSSLQYVQDVLQSNWFSYGKYNKLCEEKVKEILGVKYCILTTSGTSAMMLMARTLKNLFDFKYIAVPDNVYVAAWNPFAINDYMLSPITADPRTWNIDLDKVPTDVDAILVVHNLGNPVDMSKLPAGIPVVEDCCEAFGGLDNNIPVGSKSLCSAFSFYANKHVTSGEGGAFVTNDPDVYNKALQYWGQGTTDSKFIHNEFGFNYRMTNIQAALLYGQLENFHTIQYNKQRVFTEYKKYIPDYCNVQDTSEFSSHSNWMFGLKLPFGSTFSDKEAYFRSFGIEVRPMFYNINRHTHLSKYLFESSTVKYDCMPSINIQERVIILPSSPTLTADNVRYIMKCVREYINDRH